MAGELQLQLQLYLLFDKRKIQNGRFPQIALAGGKRQEKTGLHLFTACQIWTRYEKKKIVDFAGFMIYGINQTIWVKLIGSQLSDFRLNWATTALNIWKM